MSPQRRWLAAIFTCMSLAVSHTPAHAVTIDWVTVGDPGNANDPATGSNYGGVDSSYQIGKYDVTIQQYTDFLNAVAATDPYSLYNESMATNLFIAGIARSGSSGSYSYSVIGPSGTTPAGASSPGNRPITFVSWFDAARFANWMQNGQGSGSTETGAYTLNGATSGSAVAKNAGATVFIPTENEWYKAAYYSPPLNSGSGGYYAFATQSNSDPGNVLGGGANRANYNDGVYSVTQSDRLEGLQNYLTDVGAFTDSASFYGTFDQTGNVFQWNDLDGTAGSSRGLRGGSWLAGVPDNLRSSFRLEFAPTSESDFIGFRLASPVAVPEPSTVALVISGIAAWLWRRRASLGLAMLLLAVSASESRAVETAPSYDIPIYVKNTQQPNNYWIYVSQSASGSNAVPYLFDTGSPNMFTVQGSNTAVAATGTFKFGDGSLFYGYYVAGQSLTLTDSTSTAMTPTVPNFNAAMVVAIDGNTVDNNALADGTYGDFGAGFYGTATLSTLLTAVPLSPGSRLGYVVDVAGITSGTGSLTLGLTPEKITAIQGMPGAIQMAMNLSGQSIQTAGGTTAGYAQGLVTSTVTVNTDRGPASAALPTVFDTGGGPNGVIYYSGSSADPGLFSGVINSGSSARFSLDYQGHVFDAWSGSSPWGGAVAVIPSMSPDVNRVNTGGYLFQNYIVMVDLESATLTLAPVAVPEPATLALLATGLGGLVLCRRNRGWKRRRRLGACAAVGCVVTVLAAAAPARAVTIDWVAVGNPGNTADTTGNPNPAGAVDQSFRIMKYEWTNSQYVDFLNAVDPNGTNPNSIYNANMGSDALGGITNTGTATGSRYAAKANMGDKPVVWVTWWDAARVANWLHNGRGSGSTETGAYTLNNATSGNAPGVNAGALFFIPTENQWYKAAYYQGGGTTAGYWDYATQSDTSPMEVSASVTGVGSAGSTGNFANFNNTANWNGQIGNVTTVGTNGGPSAYGAFDMSGNALEWNDLDGLAASGSTRGLRGGSWNFSYGYLPSSVRTAVDPSYEDNYTGFRLAAVPEPATLALLATGLAGLALRSRRKPAGGP